MRNWTISSLSLRVTFYEESPVVVDDPPADLEGDSDQLDDCVDKDAFSSNGEEGDEE